MKRNQNEYFSIFFIVLMLSVSALSFWVDLKDINIEKKFWFQRSGALITFAGVNLQYSKLISLWKKAFNREMNIEPIKPTEAKISSGDGISLIELSRESHETRNFVIRIFQIVTEKSLKDEFGVLFIIIGGAIWAYGDLIFK